MSEVSKRESPPRQAKQGLNLSFQNKNILVCRRCGHPLWLWREQGVGCFLYCPKCKKRTNHVKIEKNAEVSM
jgi:Zn finger protein HypA/HybF involved in hydrogenase expression